MARRYTQHLNALINKLNKPILIKRIALMKRKFLTTAVLLCSFIVCLAAIADLNGKWTGILKIGDGNEIPLTYNFKIDGANLTGSVTSTQGEIPIYEGKINGAD